MLMHFSACDAGNSLYQNTLPFFPSQLHFNNEQVPYQVLKEERNIFKTVILTPQ